MTNLLFLAISRTGPDPVRHELCEVAVILRRPGQADAARWWHVRPEYLEHADDAELRRNRYLERAEAWQHNGEPVVQIDPTLGTTVPSSRRGVANALAGAMLESYVVTLGAERELEFAREFMRRNGHPCPHLGHLDVTAIAAGAMYCYAQGWAARADTLADSDLGTRIDASTAAELPLSPFRLAAAMGLHVPDVRESAYDRAMLAGALWAASTATPPPPPPRPAEQPAEQPVDEGPSTGPTPVVDDALGVLVAGATPLEGDLRREPYTSAADTVVMPAS